VPEKFAICLLASEVEPLSKTGGLADVAGALTRYLHGAGHEVLLFSPAYDFIDRAACSAKPVAGLTQIPLTLGSHAYVFSVLRASLPQGACAYLIDCPALYARGSIYTSDPDEHLRFLDRRSSIATTGTRHSHHFICALCTRMSHCSRARAPSSPSTTLVIRASSPQPTERIWDCHPLVSGCCISLSSPRGGSMRCVTASFMPTASPP